MRFIRLRLPLEIRFFLWLLVLLIGVFFAEQAVAHFFGDQTISPLLSVVFLGFLAWLFPWRLVLLSVPLFASMSFFMIQDSSRYPMVRATTVVVAGLLATWAARHKDCLDRQMREFEAVIKNLPLPWILTDPNGNTLKISNSLVSLAGKSEEELAGISLFAILTPPELEREPHAAKATSLRSELLQIHPFFPNRSTMIFRATYLPVVIQSEHCLLTILRES